MFFSELFSDYRVYTCGHDLAFTDIYDQSHKLFRASRALTVLHTLLRALALPQCSLQHCNIIQVIIIFNQPVCIKKLSDDLSLLRTLRFQEPALEQLLLSVFN